jgi:hypothetical protein
MASDAFGAESQAPRRSSRISGQAKVETPAIAKKPRNPSKAGIKRAAEDVNKVEKNKKVRRLKPSSLILTVAHSRPKPMKMKRLMRMVMMWPMQRPSTLAIFSPR